MKKGFWILVWLIGVVSLAAITYAQNEQKPEVKQEATSMPEKIQAPQEARGMRGMPMMANPGDMMKRMKMMSFSMVATSDGGVVIVDGDMLTKYDKDLNQIKSVKIARNMECGPDTEK